LKFKKSAAVMLAAVFLMMPELVFAAPAQTAQIMSGKDGELEDYAYDGDGNFINMSQNNIQVTDPAVIKRLQKETKISSASLWYDKMADKMADFWRQTGSKAVASALSTALNKIAYDSAVWFGSGGKGQKPLFVTESWHKYYWNIVDEAAGQFIEEVGQSGEVFGQKFNLCDPGTTIRFQIMLGLRQQQRPGAPACTFQKMVNNWEEWVHDPNFLGQFQDMFNPTSNDLGIALNIQSQFNAVKFKKESNARDELTAKKGWLDVRNIAGSVRSAPNEQERVAAFNRELQALGLNKSYVDPFIEAANIFLNQYAIERFNRLMRDLGKNSVSAPYTGDYGLGAFQAGPPNAGAAGAKEVFKALVEPRFDVRGDYNILAELSQCQNPAKAGPTNCVITEKFRQAVAERKTVGEAMEAGYLNSSGIFGFEAADKEPGFQNENYPYRSMLILRKFRIIPAGWEVAAEYLSGHPEKGPRTLKDLLDCFSAEDNYIGYQESWCRGLVDPTWVLKAPLNYCRREGYGPEIMSDSTSGAGADSRRSVMRNDNYCADEQACINEKADGSCNTYGYCTEEERKWNFGADSCEPLYNTCQTFRGRDGATASYLKNTLDYSDCSVDAVGCRQYALAASAYDAAADSITWSGAATIRLNKMAEKCNDEQEGCHEFIRTKPGGGANLVPDSSFEDLAIGDTVDFGTATTAAYQGERGVKITSTGRAARYFDIGLMERIGTDATASYYDLSGEAVAFSFYAKNCGQGGAFGITDGEPSSSVMASSVLDSTGDWQRFTFGYTFPAFYNKTKKYRFGVFIDKTDSGADDCVIDAVKVERGGQATDYNDYRESGLVYEKLAPAYLNCQADPASCADFASVCRYEDVGCEMYSSADGAAIPAKATNGDQCPAECVGYDSYIEQESALESRREEYFIPAAARTCSAEAAGCEEFTNLDQISTTTANGAENREQYASLKQCVKPGGPGANCGEFYSWEGSDESGYQLKVYQLNKNIPHVADEPAVTDLSFDEEYCNETIFNKAPSDPAYRSDCRQFYGKSGHISYHLIGLTVVCTDNCHPYRKTEKNEVLTSVCGAACAGAELCVDQASNGDQACKTDDEWSVLCKSGGVWNTQHKACVYMAVPGEGRTCSAAQVGCREYAGTKGGNMRTVFSHDFEGSLQGWQGAAGASAGLSNTALLVGGRSLAVSRESGERAASTTVGNAVETGKTYVLNFLILPKAPSGFHLAEVYLTDGVASTSFPAGSVDIDHKANWTNVKLSLENLDHVVSSAESLVIKASGDFYIDDVKLTEITDRYYLIKNSWNTPESCDQDQNGDYALYYMAGCSQYNDRENKINNLKSFSKLCSEAAVGCELMIDTHNSAAATRTEAVKDASIVTPADNYVYVVYDKKKECKQADKGCSRLGLAEGYANETVYHDAYLKNDPDKYDSILCTAANLGCEEWAVEDGLEYFKDPGKQICEWRQSGLTASSSAWYKKKVKRCGASGSFTGAFCDKDGDCSSGQTCQLDNRDIACQTASYKTFGFGGQGRDVDQPAVDSTGRYWTAACPAAESSCTEYIDPLSNFSANKVFNADLKQDVDNNNFPDGWTVIPGDFYIQAISLEPNTLYKFSVKNGSVEINNTTGVSFYKLDSNNNNLASAAGQVKITAVSPALIYIGKGGEVSATVKINALDESDFNIEIKKAVVDYQLKKEVDKVDKKEACTTVNMGEGCVLFNERTYDGKGYAKLAYDAYQTAGAVSQPMSPAASANNNNANRIIQVNPDRVCSQWLACRSMIKTANEQGKEENTCFDIGLCDQMNDSGECTNFVIAPTSAQTVDLDGATGLSAAAIANLSGYAKAGLADGIDATNLYSLGAMSQAGEIAEVPNGNFEIYGQNRYPTGWSDASSTAVWSDANPSFNAVSGPVKAKEENVSFLNEGNAFLKVSANTEVKSEIVDVMPNTTYWLSAMLNTNNLTSVNSNESITAYVDVYLINNNGTVGQKICYLEQAMGLDWDIKNYECSVDSNINKIRIHVSAKYGSPALACAGTSGHCAGSVYVDDIKIRPVLKTSVNQSAPQTCRLYPESDALSCDYYNDSGQRMKGWPGYCLEYDRAPGDPGNCLLWMPVDKVKGDGLEEGVGYSGRMPLYYAISGRPQAVYEYRHAFFYVQNVKTDGCVTPCPLGYGLPVFIWRDKRNGSRDDAFCACVPDGKDYIALDGSEDNHLGCADKDDPPEDGEQALWQHMTSKYDGWYPYNGNSLLFANEHNDYDYITISTSTNKNADVICEQDGCSEATTALDRSGSCPFGEKAQKAPCRLFREPIRSRVFVDKIVQVVSSVGQNKYWSSRVQKNSAYKTINTNLGYDAINKPFGAVRPPFPSSNPYEWDGLPYNKDDKATWGNQPLLVNNYLAESGRTNAGLAAGCKGSLQLCGSAIDESKAVPYYKFSVNNVDSTASVQRLFAKSYGTWQWNAPGTCNVLSAPDKIGQPCSNDDSCGSADMGPCLMKQCQYTYEKQGDVCTKDGASCPDELNQLSKECRANGGQNLCFYTLGLEGESCSESKDCQGFNDGSTKYTAIGCSDQAEFPACKQSAKVCSTDADCIGSAEGNCQKSFESNYVPSKLNADNWTVPSTLCNGGVRPAYSAGSDADYCAVRPVVFNIKADGVSNIKSIAKNAFVNLVFNTKVDSEQLPMVMYAVGWGDGSTTTVAGVEMTDRPNEENPHSLYHLYNYWDIKAKPGMDCASETVSGVQRAYCQVQTKVIIKDNWGWCSGGNAPEACTSWTNGPMIKVYEK